MLNECLYKKLVRLTFHYGRVQFHTVGNSLTVAVAYESFSLQSLSHSSNGCFTNVVAGRFNTSFELVLAGRLEKRETGIRNRNHNGKTNLYKNRDNIYLNFLLGVVLVKY